MPTPDSYDQGVRLGVEQGRVIGCLVEKQLTTPQQYPLSLNAVGDSLQPDLEPRPGGPLRHGTWCSGRWRRLKEAGLVRFVYPSHGGSATRDRQVLDEQLGLDKPALALVAVLLLRGPTDSRRAKSRTERMTTFVGVTAVNAELERLGTLAEPLVLRLPRRPGQKEERWVQLLAPENAALVDASDVVTEGAPRPGPDLEAASHTSVHGVESATDSGEQVRDQATADTTGPVLGALMAEVTTLRAEVAALRVLVEQLQAEEATRRAVVGQLRARLSP